MHQVIGLLSVLVTLTQAVPTPATNGIFLKYHSLSDAHDPKRVGVLQERSINLPSCFGSGASMKIDDLYAGIAVWCQQQDGISVPMGKSLNVGYGGIFLANGGLGTFNAHYTNDKVPGGWVVLEESCKSYMHKVVDGCKGIEDDSQGGYVVDDTYGSVWVNANAA